MKKLQSYFVFKFNTSRLKIFNYKIKISVNEARLNKEVVRLGDSSMLKYLRKIIDREYSLSDLSLAEKELKKIRKSRNTVGNKERLEKTQYKIDRILYIPELANIVFDDTRHYSQIMKKGLYINGEKYVRLLSGAGMARKQTVLFIQERYYEKMRDFLSCGADKNYQINPQKYNAYYALGASSGHEIQYPRFCVIPDLEVERPTKVDFVSENPNPRLDPIVEEKTISQIFNLFDGMGLMTPSYANSIAYDLEMDYTPASVIFRSAFLKGLLVTFDFKEFAGNRFEVIDIYGKVHDIRDLDVILTASQFKLSGAYESLDAYIYECNKREYGWSVTRVSPKKDKHKTVSTYQYLQVLNLSKEDIEKLCKPTVDYIKNVSGLDYKSVMIYLIGSLKKEDITKKWFDNLEPMIKVLFYEPSLINDTYIQNKIRRMLSKRVRESYMGVLDLEGNYQFIIADPVALVQHALGIEVTGLLAEDQFYSNYWNKKDVTKIAAMRSPLTWESEANVFNLVKNEETEYWYKYLNSGIVLNVHKDVSMNLGGSD